MTGITKRQRERLEKVRNNVYIGESIRAALTALDQYERERKEWQRIIAEAQAENQRLGELHTNRESAALDQYEALVKAVEETFCDDIPCARCAHLRAALRSNDG